MSSTRLINFATPWGWLAAAVALVTIAALAIFALGGLGFRFDPLNTVERRADRAEQAAAIATVDGGARAQEVIGARDTVVRVEVALDQQHQAAAIAADFATQAREAPNANEPLDPGRLGRLAASDQRLCALSPDVCPNDAAAPRDAGDG